MIHLACKETLSCGSSHQESWRFENTPVAISNRTSPSDSPGSKRYATTNMITTNAIARRHETWTPSGMISVSEIFFICPPHPLESLDALPYIHRPVVHLIRALT